MPLVDQDVNKRKHIKESERASSPGLNLNLSSFCYEKSLRHGRVHNSQTELPPTRTLAKLKQFAF